MKNKIVTVLLELEMPADMKGFDFITEYIMLLNDKNWHKCEMTTLYYKIAKDNDVSPQTVERCIRYAFCYVLRKGNQEALKKYLNTQRTNNGNLLKILHHKIFTEE